MVEFIEKEPFTDTDPFIGETYAPVFMVRDGVEYFVINRVASIDGDSFYARQANGRLEAAKQMLAENDGRYCMFYGPDPDPEKLLKEIERRGHTFTEPEDLFADCHDAIYGGGFVDFHGNLNEVSAAFMYRIFDSELVEKLKKQAQPIVERSVENE
ncbi:hypothetical protein [Clostridium sp. D33t1_170424_F3]|uniref:hypothetical protein n=1 Tax=Clostridium sp. D33t1_170424_F3 TaxID=2787099 RepID=UPI0018A88E31|nr:hypothetical protein [Clostridium sp. D33t1_170424_F3]